MSNTSEPFDHYLACALWASTFQVDSDDDIHYEFMDANFSINDFDEKTREKMLEDFHLFFQKSEDLLEEASDKYAFTEEEAAHDFFLARNRHGVGFIDRDLGEVGKRLYDIALTFGEVHLYPGEDGKIYIY